MKLFWYYLFFLISFSALAQPEFPEVALKNDHAVSAVCFSPEGRLAAGSNNGAIYLWNTLTQHKDNVLDEEEGTIYQVVFGTDANTMASCGKSEEAYVWDVHKGLKKIILKGHKGNVMAISISHDGNYIATGGEDGKIMIWDLHNGNLKHEFTDHDKEISCLEFGHKSNMLASADMEGIIKIYNVDRMSLERRIQPESGKIRAIAYSPNDQYLAYGGDDELLKVWDVNLGYCKITLEGHKKSLFDIEYSPDGKYIASSGLDNRLIIWNVAEQKQHATLKSFYKLVGFSFSYNGKELAVADLENEVKIFMIDSLNINEKNPLNIHKQSMLKQGGMSEPPVISMTQPFVKQDERYIIDKENEFVVKGKIESNAGIFLLLVNGKETYIKENGEFEQTIPIKYLENDMVIKAIDLDKKVSEFSFTIFKPMNGEVSAENLMRHGRDYALLIGTDEYQAMTPLSNPVFDVTTISEELENNYNFQTEKLLNPSMEEVYKKLRAYSMKQYSSEDQLFIFIAGHGEFDKIFNEGYLVCKDSKKGDLSRSSYISHSNLRTLVNNIKCEHIFLVLDACFGGTFDPVVAQRGTEDLEETKKNEFIVRKMKHKTRLYLTSGGKEYVPDGRPGHHSPFTRNFLEALRSYGGNDKILTSNEVKTYVEKVTPEPRYGQFGDNEPGSDFLFISK